MYEVIRWVSIVFMWLAVAANVWAFFRSQKAYKQADASWAVCEKIISNYKGREPVVYCYECEYYDKATVNDKGFLICPASGMDITAHDYCSFSERKTEQDLTSEGK